MPKNNINWLGGAGLIKIIEQQNFADKRTQAAKVLNIPPKRPATFFKPSEPA